MKAAHAKAAPPRPLLTLCVGVTGHRDIDPAAHARLAGTLDDLLGRLAALTGDIHSIHSEAFLPEPPQLFLLSQLAAGADQIAAQAALTRGYGLRAVLPFDRKTFRRDFDRKGAAAFDRLMNGAACWSLPKSDAPRERAYALAGQATVAQCDILIAVWDGEQARGLGGTADVIDYGVRRSVPVIHVPLDPKGEITVLWAGFDGLSADRLDRESAPRRPLTQEVLGDLAHTLLSPPEAAEERTAIAAFFKERMRRIRYRPEYPLLLALTGVRGLRRRDFIQDDHLTATTRDWASFRNQAATAGESGAKALDVLEPAFAWSDGLADQAAQAYRSGLVFNYVAAALSVVMALASLIVPDAKIGLQFGELVAIALLILNTSVGGRQAWHRRWLDYRYLAEQLRPLRSLKLLGAATPPHQRSGATGRWTDWYARAIWRQMGTPPTIPDEKALGELLGHITDEEVMSQVAYNEASAHRMHKLDHRLHLIGNLLFYATAGMGVLTLIALNIKAEVVHAHAPLLTALSAGLPTIGAAIFGIRGQGDFVGASGRAAETAENLRAAAAGLAVRPVDLTLACRSAENVAVTMLADLGEWRTAYRHRKLAIPA